MEDLECWCNTVWLDFVPLDLEQDKRYGLMQCQLWHYVTWDKKTIRHTGLQIIWSLYWRLLIMGARWNPIISFIFQVRTQTDTQACTFNNPILVMKKIYYTLKLFQTGKRQALPTRRWYEFTRTVFHIFCQWHLNMSNFCLMQLNAERTADFAACCCGCSFQVWKGF